MKSFNINKGISDITKVVDDSFESNDELNQKISERHALDMTSPFKLPHLIRPISMLYSGIIWGISIIWTLVISSIMIAKVGIEGASIEILSPDSIIMYVLAATTANYATHVGFYFNSRRTEKNTAKKVAATIKLEEIKIKETIRKEKVVDRRDRRKENQDKRDKRKARRND